MTLEKLTALAEPYRDELIQFVSYFLVSGCALGVDMTIYWLALKVAPYAFVAAGFGYVFGVFTHYLLSSRIVFADRFDKRGVRAEAPTLVKFYLAGAVGLVVTACVVGLLADVLGLHPIIAKVFAAGCSFVSVFTCMRLFVFTGRPRPPTTGVKQVVAST